MVVNQKRIYCLHPPLTKSVHSSILKGVATDSSKALPILPSNPNNPPSNILEMN